MSVDLAPREFQPPAGRGQVGLLLIYTGNGKGKSTAGFGAIFRSLGHGMKVAVVQFIKGRWVSGEVEALKKFGDQCDYFSVGDGFTWETKSLEQDIASAEKGWTVCEKLLRDNRHDVYLFDEILYVLKYQFLPLERVISGLALRAPRAHVIVTGRDAPPKLVELADLVSEMKEVKHPFSKGITAQAGIDY